MIKCQREYGLVESISWFIKNGALESINNEAWFLNQEIRVEPRLVVPLYAFCVHRDFFI